MRSPCVELDEAYASGDMLTVCWETHDKRHNYTNCTQSICDQHFRISHCELKRLMDEEVSRVEAELHLVVAAG